MYARCGKRDGEEWVDAIATRWHGQRVCVRFLDERSRVGSAMYGSTRTSVEGDLREPLAGLCHHGIASLRCFLASLFQLRQIVVEVRDRVHHIVSP